MKYSTVPTILMIASLIISLPACNRIDELTGGVPLAEVRNPEVAHDDAGHTGVGEDESEVDIEHNEHSKSEHHPAHKILVTRPVVKDVTSTQEYVCQIHSRRHIDVCALEGGYLEAIPVKEGQAVKEGEVMFKILPTLYQAKLNAELAEAQQAKIELQNVEKLFKQNIVSQPEVALTRAKYAKALAKVELTQAELNFANIKAPFDGIIDRLHEQQGSLIDEGEVLTTLSDNRVMWVYFNVPESRYLEYKAELDDNPDAAKLKIELKLANHNLFDQVGSIGAIEADFNNTTGNIAFRADFPNPNALLRHGQTGKVLINRVLPNAIVIPQRATFEILAKKYAFVVGDDGVVRQREIDIQNEMDDIFVIKEGLSENDNIILEGIRQVRDGDQVEYEFRDPAEVLVNLKNHAE